MLRLPLLPLVAVTLLTGPAASARDSAPTGSASESAPAFMLADVDGDGRVTLDELLTLLNARYSALDADGDGRVAVADLARASDESARPRFVPPVGGMPPPPPGGFRGPPPGGPGGPGRPGGPPPGPPPGGGDNLAPGFPFPRPEDSDEDGFITRAEYVAPAAAMLDAWDRNRDGAVTANEARSSPGDKDDARRP